MIGMRLDGESVKRRFRKTDVLFLNPRAGEGALRQRRQRLQVLGVGSLAQYGPRPRPITLQVLPELVNIPAGVDFSVV